MTFTEDVATPSAWAPGVSVIDTKTRRWELRATAELGPLVTTLAALPVADIEIVERRLEDVVIDYYRGDA